MCADSWGLARAAPGSHPQAAAAPAHCQLGRNVDLTLGFNLHLVYGNLPIGIIKVSGCPVVTTYLFSLTIFGFDLL